jgi:hypothetical protein
MKKWHKDRYEHPKILPLKRLYILRVKDLRANIEIDLCVNNILGILNSELIRTYCLLDSRYHSMCRIMKYLHEMLEPYG